MEKIIDDSTSLSALTAFLITLLLVLTPLSYIANAFVTDSGFTITENRTMISSMKEYNLIGPKDLTQTLFIPDEPALLVAGTGYVSLIDMSVQPPTVMWAWSIIGTATYLAADDYANPQWYVVGTDKGEILAVNAKNPDFRVSYFTASRAAIKKIEVGSLFGKTSLVVEDVEGYLYIYKLPESGWMEIGPAPRDGSLSSIGGLTIKDVSMATYFTNVGDWHKLSNMAVASVEKVDPLFYSGIVLKAYVLHNGKIEPAMPGIKPVEENTTLRSKLYYGIGVYPYNLIIGLYNVKDWNITVSKLLPTKTSVVLLYVEETLNTTTHEVINSTCYIAKTPYIQLIPGFTIDLGKVILYQEGNTTEDCLLKLGAPVVDSVDFDPLLVINSFNLPKTEINFVTNGDVWLVPLLKPVNNPGLSQGSLLRLFKITNTTQNLPDEANALLLAGVQRYLYIYLLGNDMFPLPLNVENYYTEIVDVGSKVTDLTVSPDGEMVFVGTATGKVYWLVWNKVEKRFIVMASLQIDKAGITSLTLLKEGYLLVSTGSGRLQLVELASDYKMIPLWRGPYEYEGIDTPLSNVKAEANSKDLIVASSTQSDGTSFYTLRLDTIDIVKVSITASILYTTLTGSYKSNIPYGSYLEVYRKDTGEEVIKVTPEDDTFRFYVESGEYILSFYIPGIGYILKNVSIEFPEYKDEYLFTLRKIIVSVYVPEPQKNETYPPNVKPGPLNNALVKLEPVYVEPSLGLNITPAGQMGYTSSDGEVSFYVWDGVAYRLYVTASGYTNYTTIIPSWGPQKVSVGLKPLAKQNKTQTVVKLYPLSIRVINDRGEPLSGAIVEIYDSKGALVFSSGTDNNGAAAVQLKEGSYRLIVKASGYLDGTQQFNIPDTKEITIALQPTTQLKVKRMFPLLLVVVGILILVGILYAIRRRIASWLSEKEEYF